MTDTEAPITEWIKELEGGNEQAARELWSRYFHRVCRFASERLGDTPRRVNDSEDVALSAFQALCAGAKEGRFRQLENRNDLWQLLAMIASRKATNEWRKASRRKELGESELHGAVELVADRETQSLESLTQTCAEMLPRLDGKLLDVALMKLEGYSNAEIAAKRGRSEKTIERYLRMIRAKWTD